MRAVTYALGVALAAGVAAIAASHTRSIVTDIRLCMRWRAMVANYGATVSLGRTRQARPDANGDYRLRRRAIHRRTKIVADTIIVTGRYIIAMKPVVAAEPMLRLASRESPSVEKGLSLMR